jgi:hypothetical protein
MTTNRASKRLLTAVATAAATVAATAGLLGTGTAQAAVTPARPAAQSASTWGKAEEVPGMAKLNRGPQAQVDAMSCTAVGDCTATGEYGDGTGSQAFAVSEVNGTWRTAAELPGTAALNTGNSAGVLSVSCASPGNCGAGGDYSAGSAASPEAFVASQVNGKWGTAEEVPGTAALNAGQDASVTSVSCRSAGNCTAGGYYASSHLHWQAFVVSEQDGSWGTAAEVPGTAALNQGNDARLTQVSCGSAGNCAAVGFYTDSSGRPQGFVASEVNGTWAPAGELSGAAGLDTGTSPIAGLSVSCAAAGNCGAGGYYLSIGGARSEQSFLVSEVNGRWEAAQAVPGIAAGANPEIDSVSCPAAGACVAAGHDTNASGDWQAVTVAERNGRWGRAAALPGQALLGQGSGASVFALSCPAPGDCAAVGSYANSAGQAQAFVAGETGGHWAKATNIPGLARLDKPAGDQDDSFAVSCAAPGQCSAGGYYSDQPTVYTDPFVVSES